MKTTKYKGFGKIFRFTLEQRIKTKGYRTATFGGALLCLLVPLTIMVCMAVFGGKNEASPNRISTVYVVDETGFTADYNILNQTGWEGYDQISYENSADFVSAEEQAEKKDNTAVLVVQSSEDTEQLSLILPERSNISKDELQGLKYFLTSTYSYIQMIKTGLNTEELEELTAPVTVSEHKSVNEQEDSLARIRDIMSFAIPYLTVMVLYFLVLFYGQGVAGSILMEKTSKLMDTFLLCVQPGGMVLGKVLAHVLAALLQIGSWLIGLTAGFAGGTVLVKQIHPGTQMALIQFFDHFGFISGLFTLPGILAAVLMMIGGFFLYCSLAAIGGAIAGKQEELSTTNLLFTMALVISFLAVFTAGGLGTATASTRWMNWMPFSAVLIVPGRALLGQMPMWEAYASFGVVMVVSVLIILVSGKLYQALALYRGKLPKVSELWKILRSAS